MKRILSLVLAMVMVLGSFSAVFAAEQTAAEKAGAFLKEAGVLEGNASGDLKLDTNLKRQDAIIVLSRLMGVSETAKDFPSEGLAFTDVNDAFYKGYVAWAVANNYTNGKSETKFGFNDPLTAQQFATFILRALEYDVTEKADYDKALETAKGLGILADLEVENTTQLKRGMMAVMTYNALDVKVKDSTKTLAEKLNIEMPVVTPEVPATLEVVSVSANNLKEVEVVLNKAVDKITAENKDAYSLKQGIAVLPLESAVVLEDGKTIRLTLTGTFTNQMEAQLAITGVKAAEGTQILTVKEQKFTPIDVAAPVVEKVESLGNKAIKVTFSEPVTMINTVASTFKINDLAVSGIHTNNGRTIIIQLFNVLPSGEHKISINNNIRDYATIQLVATNLNFTVVEDKVAPAIAEVKNVTLEEVTVVFTEDVQTTEALTAGNYYWLQGTTKKKATSVEQIDGKTFRVNFTTNRLPGYTVELFVTNVKDYSGNVIAADSKVAVTATLDQSRPEVLTAIFDGVNKNKMTITFTKNIDTDSFKASNVVIKRANGTVASNGYTHSVNGKVLVVNFANAITTAGTYTFEISGMTDATLLKNAMLPFSTEFIVSNTTAPTAGTSVTGTLPHYIITFSKAMDTTTSYSILNPANYYVTYNTADITGITGNLPAGTNLVPTADNKSVIITFPAGVTGVTKLVVQGVKDTHGNYLAGFAKEYTSSDFTSALVATQAKATGVKTVYVKMNQPVGTVTAADFTISGGNSVAKAEVDAADNTLVKLTLTNAISSNVNGITVTAVLSSNTVGITGSTLAASAALPIRDAIAPSVVLNGNDEIAMGTVSGAIYGDSGSALTQITIKFDENIMAENQALINQNFMLYRADGIKLVYGLDYQISGPLTNSNLVVLNLNSTGSTLVGYVGSIDVVFDNTNENIYDFDTYTFVTSTTNYTLANGFDTRTDDKTGSLSVAYGKPAAPAFVVGDAIPSTHEYKLKDTTDAFVPGSGAALPAGTYLIRVKATGLYPAGLTQEITIP